jgi:hypothetical protein
MKQPAWVTRRSTVAGTGTCSTGCHTCAWQEVCGMRNLRQQTGMLYLIIGCLILSPSFASAHRSGCHRWHSCPSDRGTYVCGDLGYCSACPDNQYCTGGHPRSRESKQPSPQPRPSTAKEQCQTLSQAIMHLMQQRLKEFGYDIGFLSSFLPCISRLGYPPTPLMLDVGTRYIDGDD